jgi:hypothetical protein
MDKCTCKQTKTIRRHHKFPGGIIACHTRCVHCYKTVSWRRASKPHTALHTRTMPAKLNAMRLDSKRYAI